MQNNREKVNIEKSDDCSVYRDDGIYLNTLESDNKANAQKN